MHACIDEVKSSSILSIYNLKTSIITVNTIKIRLKENSRSENTNQQFICIYFKITDKKFKKLLRKETNISFKTETEKFRILEATKVSHA